MEGMRPLAMSVLFWVLTFTVWPSLVELECAETLMYVSRTSKAQKSEPIPLDIRCETGEEELQKEFRVPLPLGESITASYPFS